MNYSLHSLLGPRQAERERERRRGRAAGGLREARAGAVGRVAGGLALPVAYVGTNSFFA